MRKLRTCEIELSERLNGLERDWLVGRLLEQQGVADAAYCGQHWTTVSIVYDSNVVTTVDLEGLVDACGFASAASSAISTKR
jgi:hypothetical protein